MAGGIEAVWLNDLWYIVVVKFGCASSRIPWDKLKFDLVYGQTEGDEEEKKSLLNDLDSNFDRADNGYYEIEFEEAREFRSVGVLRVR